MPNEEDKIKNFVEDNQLHLLQLLFFGAEGEWDQIVGEDPNSRIIEGLNNPQDMDNLISSIKNKIQTITYQNQIAKYIFSLEKAIKDHLNQDLEQDGDKSVRLESLRGTPTESPTSPKHQLITTREESVAGEDHRNINSSVRVNEEQFSGELFFNNRVSPEVAVSIPRAEDSCFKKLSRFFTNCCDSSQNSR